MKKKIQIIIVSFLFVSLIIIVFYLASRLLILNIKYVKTKEELTYTEMEVKYAEKLNDEILESSFAYLTIDDKNLQDIQITKVKISLKDEVLIKRSNTWRLKQLFDRKYIIFRFFSTNCSSCIIDQLKLQQQIYSNLHRKRIILLTDHLNSSMREFLINNKIEINVYETGDVDIGFEFDRKKIPYLFVCGNDMNISMPFIIDNRTSSHSEHFYKAAMDLINM